MNSYRTHTCSELRAANIGKPTTLIGWVDSVRDHGGVIFIDLRDRSGITQVVFHPEVNQDVAKASQQLRSEDMIQISGTVAARLKTDTVDTTNADLPTGEIEVSADTLNVINKADVLPFQLDRALSNEDLRLKYRFLDLRRPAMARNMQIRHRVTKTTRDYLDEHGFLEIETPILSKSTPEGARDFLVPSRLAPGKFYALPQAPQQYKQLLMVAGMERYFQIARCFRDEDLRADRQPEFTQVDIEASFITPEDIYNLVEGLLKRVYKESLGVDIPTPFPRMTWKEAMDQYGSDKPKGLLNEGQAITKFDNLEIYIDKRVDDVIHGMHIYQKADDKSPSVAMHSERVTMDFSPEKKILTLHLINPLITTQEEGSISQSVTMDEMPLSINLDKSRSRRIKANRFTNREIREALDTPGYLDKKQTTEFATELPRRASFSLACIVFALIGVPLAINTRRKDTSTGFALGILIASLYFLALIFADLSRKNDTMLPYILLWLPNIITVAVALHLHKRARHKG